jgi:3-methyladenine DNA glycosylase/8-oxoguanine DNA glycosylase
MTRPFDQAQAIRHLRSQGGPLARLIRRAAPFSLRPQRCSIFESLLKAIVYQQLNGRAAATIYGRLAARIRSEDAGPIDPARLLQCPQEDLRAAGLSASKAASARDLAGKCLDGTVPGIRTLNRLDDEAVIARLTHVRGIGEWTAQMLLIFRLVRPDVLPAADYGVRKGFWLTYGGKDLPTPKTILEFGDCWRPYRTVASWYLWRAVDLATQLPPTK